MSFSAVIVCAGSGTRTKLNVNKVMLPLGGKPVFMHSVDVFKKLTDDVIVVSNNADYEAVLNYHQNAVIGGKTRMDSVYNGVCSAKYENVLIHDGARPFVTENDIQKMIDSFDTSECSFLAAQEVNSIKDISNCKPIDRDLVVVGLTPQYVKKDDFIEAYSIANKNKINYTDDVTLVSEILDKKIVPVLTENSNMKITTSDDYYKAVKMFDTNLVGYSWDIHRLVSGRKLILGGYEIPYEKGLLGHSDADALLHAISEALLGSLALGDLGKFYPDNSPNTLNMNSSIILKEVYGIIKNAGYRLVNVDTMIFAEKPKMYPYIYNIRESIASILKIPVERVSVKATTHEGLGLVGNEEAIAASATVLITKEGGQNYDRN